jgi:hypothetical protein
MGTNFYVDSAHIGKRSAAGWWCWDCGLTLCKNGLSRVHFDESKWHKACPSCGKKPTKESIGEGAVGRELGFNKEPFAPKSGVSSCSSFTWAMNPSHLRQELARKRIKDEYGTWFSRKEFAALLTECPIQYYEMIGHEFS